MRGCRVRTVASSLFLTIALVGCGDSTGLDEGQVDEEFVIQGTVQNNTPDPIPPNARVVVAWAVSATSPDYSYVFGEGTIDPSGTTFEVVLDAAPPSSALNRDALGVGIIAVTTNPSVSTGDDLSDIPQEEILGGAGQYGVIYVADPSAAAEFLGWAEDFESGYGAGVGGPEVDGYESFVPTDASQVELIIDDLDNITFVNWT